jgi:hypothetical protein
VRDEAKNQEIKFVQTSIASERPGIADISPPTTLSVKSSFFCSHNKIYILNSKNSMFMLSRAYLDMVFYIFIHKCLLLHILHLLSE